MNFIHEDFLLDTEQVRVLCHDDAKDMPTIDYHCLLHLEQLGNNK